MPLEDSPSLENYKEGMPANLPNPEQRRRRLLWIIGLLLAVILVVQAINFLRSPLGVVLRGQATIRGQVVNQLGQPIPAEVIVMENRLAVIAGSDGRFVIPNAPAGQISIVADYQGVGVEVPVNLKPGDDLDIGSIRVAATALP